MPIYKNIVDGNEVEEIDDGLKQRVKKNLPSLDEVVRIIKDKSDYSVVSHSECQGCRGKIILEKNSLRTSLLFNPIRNSGDSREKKRWQVRKDIYEKNLFNPLLGVYVTGEDSYIFTLSEDEDKIERYEGESFTSSWIAYDGLIKDCALIKDSMLTGWQYDKKKSTGRMRIAFHQVYFEQALDTIISDECYESFDQKKPRENAAQTEDETPLIDSVDKIDSLEKTVLKGYSFFPGSEAEITKKLVDFPEDNLADIKSLFNYLKPYLSKPINININKPNNINVFRKLKDIVGPTSNKFKIRDIEYGAKLKKIKIKFGNGSSGNRGANNQGSKFEEEFTMALKKWIDGESVEDKEILCAIEDLNKIYDFKDSKTFKVDNHGNKNTRRPLQFFGSKIELENPLGKGFDVGPTITDVTVTTDCGPLYLSLKTTNTTTFFNVGVKKIMPTAEIKSGKISHKDGLALMKMLGIDNEKFCKVFNGGEEREGETVNDAKVDMVMVTHFLKSGIGMNYHMIHKISNRIHSSKMDETAMNKAVKVSNDSNYTIYYGGKGGVARRVDMEMTTGSFLIALNIRDTSATSEHYPNRMMCDFQHRKMILGSKFISSWS